MNKQMNMPRRSWAIIIREVLIIFLSAVVAMLLPYGLIKYGGIRTPRFAYALMFFIYSQSYLFLKKHLLQISLATRRPEFELVSGALTLYMLVMLPIMKDWPDIVGLPACYWTFIFISLYISIRGKRHNNRLLPNAYN